MKMTRLEWRYLQRIALDHPFFDTHELPLTEREAKAIVEANIKMTGRAFVDSIYAKLGMTRPEEEKKRFAWLRNIGELFTVPPIRKIAIAVLIIVLMTVFFAVTPTGRAIAESVIQYIVTLFEDGGLSIYRNDTVEIPYMVEHSEQVENYSQERIESTTDYTFVESFDEFISITNKKPFILPFLFLNLCYAYDEELDYLSLYAIYDTKDGTVVTNQIWNADIFESFTSIGYMEYETDSTIYYSIEEDEGLIQYKIVLDDSIVTISSKGDYSIDDMIEMLE